MAVGRWDAPDTTAAGPLDVYALRRLPRRRANGPGLEDLCGGPPMASVYVFSGTPSCTVCGVPVRSDNKVGICDRTPACRRVRAQLAYTPAKWEFSCSVCDRGIRADNHSGVCQRSPECRREHDRRRHIANRAKRLAVQKQYRDRPGRACRYWASGCTEHAVIGGHACREHARQEGRALHAAHRTNLVNRLAEAQHWICTWEICWQPILPDHQVEIDHIIPISSGIVIQDEWNLQVLHQGCNRAKGSKITGQSVRLAWKHGIELISVGD